MGLDSRPRSNVALLWSAVPKAIQSPYRRTLVQRAGSGIYGTHIRKFFKTKVRKVPACSDVERKHCASALGNACYTVPEIGPRGLSWASRGILELLLGQG